MSEIDVEPVDDADDESEATGEGGGEPTVIGGERRMDIDVDAADPPAVDAPEYVLYGGKGGVGKTTMAAATALASARAGTRTLVVSTDPAHSLGDTFETDVPPRPGRLREDVPLYGAAIDPETAIEDSAFGEGGPLGGDGPLGGGSATDGPDGPLGGEGGPFGGESGPLGGEGGPLGGLLGGASMPGADEAAAMQTLLEYLDDDRFDRVVVDTAPTGHTLRLLELPEVMDSMVGRILTLRERLGGMFEGLKGMFGADVDGGGDDLQELRERIERLRGVLQDPARTDFRVVMVPEEMSVVESKRLLDRLAEFEIPVSTVVVNKVMEDLADVTDAVDADAFVSPDLENCEFCQRRWTVQQDALAAAQETFVGHEVRRVPLLAEEVRGERALGLVARCLA